MATTMPARNTHAYDGELVVFQIGMNINKPWRPDKWVPVFAAMPRMLKELATDPDSGLLGFNLHFGRRGPVVIQYWNSAAKLYEYANDPNAQHRPAWAAFNRDVRKSPGAVDVWHETFAVARAESVYVGKHVTGLAAAAGARPIRRALDRAADRMAAGDSARPEASGNTDADPKAESSEN